MQHVRVHIIRKAAYHISSVCTCACIFSVDMSLLTMGLFHILKCTEKTLASGLPFLDVNKFICTQSALIFFFFSFAGEKDNSKEIIEILP